MDRQGTADPADATWWGEATDWIREVSASEGFHLQGPIEVHRMRAWSTTLVARSIEGRLWFKANCPAFAFEPALVRAVHAVAPGWMLDPVAIDPRRGWMLTRDGGPTLGADHPPTLDDWTQVVQQMGRLQRALADHATELLATGLPDCRPASVVHRFDDLVEAYATTRADHPSHLDGDEYAALVAQRPQLAAAAQLLHDAAVPTSLQHGDLHPWNVFAQRTSRGNHRLFDLGDAQWAAPLEVLAVPYGLIAQASGIAWTPVLHAYREVWSDVVDARSFDALVNATHLTHPVNRAATWRAAVGSTPDAARGEWAGEPREHLRNLLPGRS